MKDEKLKIKKAQLKRKQAQLEKKEKEEKKAIAELRKEKDQIRNTLGRAIIVCGKKHIIVPVEDRPLGLEANYKGHYGWALSKIETD